MFDWNLLITAITGLGGVAVGGFVTWKIQDKQLTHIDENRFQEQRMAAYSKFVTSSGNIISSDNPHKRIDDLVELTKQYELIRLMASDEVSRNASGILNILSEHVKNEGESSKKLQSEHKGLLEKLFISARKELKIDTNI